MKIRSLFSVPAIAIACLATPAHAHEVPNMEHTHAFKQTGYGSYRQGHSVNGPQGSIIIWSPRVHSGYRNGTQVRFARPEPITKPPGSPRKKSRLEEDPALRYGKQ